MLSVPGPSSEELTGELTRMAEAIRHRGPDDHGTWCDAMAGIGLAHRRLSIVDLSPTGHQPMLASRGRHVIVFNGEIYNYRELRAELAGQGAQFRGTSDTEVLLAGIEAWGFEATLRRCIGMFALAVWDMDRRELLLARDRFGEKPLYVGRFGECLLFGSELSALRASAQWRGQIDRGSLVCLMRNDYIPAPYSIFQEVTKLMPGGLLRARLERGQLRVEESSYFSLMKTASACALDPFRGSDAQALATLEQLLGAAIARQRVADVPLGAFLSGGIDSSLVVALMQQQSHRPVRTFSIGFSEKEYDESPHAREMARRLGTEHTEYEVTPKDALEVIPLLPSIYDEPFADSSQIPTFLVSRLARREVTVSLSGDAGDELFGGYGRYPDLVQRWQRTSSPAARLKRLAGGLINALPADLFAVVTGPSRLLPRWRAPRATADALRELSIRWAADGPGPLYASMRSLAQRPAELVRDGREHPTVFDRSGEYFDRSDLLRSMMVFDADSYLHDDILVKVDRAAMAVSLETRVPFLDIDVARFAWSVPTALHFRDGRGKWLLRQLLARFVPAEVFERPKQGFAVPVARWLRGELRDWAEALIDPARLRAQGLFDAQTVQRRWLQHQCGAKDWSPNLWGILMFQAWADRWKI